MDSYTLFLVYVIYLVFFSLGIYLLFKTKKEYRAHQKRTRCTSILCILYHELFVVFAFYTAWMSTWPIINLNENLYFHYIFFLIGLFPSLLGVLIYLLYFVGIKSIPRAMGRNADEIMTEGIYKISRNPQSLGRGLGLIGIGIMSRSFFTLFLALTWITINHFYILSEEKHLEHTFGDSYLQYRSSTPRYYKVIKKKANKISLSG